jgi:hypothetical protein
MIYFVVNKKTLFRYYNDTGELPDGAFYDIKTKKWIPDKYTGAKLYGFEPFDGGADDCDIIPESELEKTIAKLEAENRKE